MRRLLGFVVLLWAATVIGTEPRKEKPVDLAKMKAEVEAQVRPAWTQTAPKPDPDIQKAVIWTARLSPALPAHWPPEGDGTVVFEIYATGHRRSLYDGAQVAAPWTRARVSPDGVIALEAGHALEDLGIQGVRPVAKSLFDALEASERELAAVVRGRSLPQGSALRDGYCGWLNLNGVIAERLKVRNPAFFHWLACGESAKPTVPRHP